jgi:hypothetical protein
MLVKVKSKRKTGNVRQSRRSAPFSLTYPVSRDEEAISQLITFTRSLLLARPRVRAESIRELSMLSTIGFLSERVSGSTRASAFKTEPFGFFFSFFFLPPPHPPRQMAGPRKMFTSHVSFAALFAFCIFFSFLFFFFLFFFFFFFFFLLNVAPYVVTYGKSVFISYVRRVLRGVSLSVL